VFVLFFQIFLWLELIEYEIGHVFLITIGSFMVKRFRIVGTFHSIIHALFNDTLPIPMLAISTLRIVPALA
jgi:hypothetical protein